MPGSLKGIAMPELNAIVTQRADLAPGLMILRVAPDGWKLPAFRAGQFGVLGLPGAEGAQEKFPRRAYSIASSSREREYLEFYLVEVKSGALTPLLFSLQPGDRVWLGPKFTGLFTLDEVDPARHVAFVATGTGLAPYMSMLRTHLNDSSPSRRFAVVHGARFVHDLGYREELFHLRRDHPNFTYLPVVSRPGDEQWQGATGHLQDIWAQGVLARAWGFKPTPADTDIFLCGNPAMVGAMQKLLEAEGFVEQTRNRPGQLHFEKYW
jgi:ferredoxin--NADP+ reductase